MSSTSLLRLAMAFLAWVTCLSVHAASPILLISPAAVTNTYTGNLTIQVTGLTSGQTVIVEKYIDLNGNGVVDPGEPLIRQFRLTDGGASVIGGVTNINVPFDADGSVNSAVSAGQRFDRLAEVERVIGRYVYRITDTGGAPLGVPAAFQVNVGTFAQAVTGSVVNSSTNVPFATVFVLTTGNDNIFIGGTFADSSGNYSLPAPVGDYIVIASRPGYVGSFDTAPLASLAAGVNSSANIPLLLADRSLNGKFASSSQPTVGVPGIQMFVQSTNNLYLLAVTDQGGNFNLPVTSNLWSLEASSESLASLGFIAPGKPLPSFLTTTGSVLAASVLVDPATALIYGRILNTNNLPATNAVIAGFVPNNGSQTRSSANGLGFYSLGVTAGTWSLNFTLPGLPGQFIDGTNINVTAGQALLANFTAKSYTAYIDGYALDQNGIPLVSRQVVVTDQLNSSQYIVTDGSGHFRAGVTGGKTWYAQLEVSEAAQNNQIGSSVGYPVTDGLDVSNVVVWARTATGFIQGTIKDSLNAALVGFHPFANLTFNGTNYNAGGDVQSDGRYQIPVFNGLWTVGVGGDFGARALVAPANQPATVANNTATVNFVASPIQRAQLGPLSRSSLGQILFTVTGSPGVTYRVETSTTLAPGSWTFLGTVTISAPFETINDSRPVGDTPRYYRVIFQH